LLVFPRNGGDADIICETDDYSTAHANSKLTVRQLSLLHGIEQEIKERRKEIKINDVI